MPNQNKPTFFVVTPSYNQAQYLKQTIDSVLNQSEGDIHYWVIDGGSSDDSKKILSSYKKQIQWISEPDKGQTHAINKGIKKLQKNNATDPNSIYFSYINSDDYYTTDAFHHVAQAFQQHPQKMWLTGNYQIVSDLHQKTHQSIADHWKGFTKKVYSGSLLKILNPIAQPATFIRWSAVKKVGLFNQSLNYTMDYEYWLRLQQAFGSPIFIPKKLAAFRIHQSSKGGAEYQQQFNEQYQVAQTFTQNQFILTLHKIHNWATIKGYKKIK